jgi:3-hydroxyisobutyrate dehydrogenase-like beta-hydroxyacid dehydrogenase
LATEAGVLITLLPGAGEVRAVMLGAAGALEGLAAGSTWIDMTSSSPSAVRPVRERAGTARLAW